MIIFLGKGGKGCERETEKDVVSGKEKHTRWIKDKNPVHLRKQKTMHSYIYSTNMYWTIRWLGIEPWKSLWSITVYILVRQNTFKTEETVRTAKPWCVWETKNGPEWLQYTGQGEQWPATKWASRQKSSPIWLS